MTRLTESATPARSSRRLPCTAGWNVRMRSVSRAWAAIVTSCSIGAVPSSNTVVTLTAPAVLDVVARLTVPEVCEGTGAVT